MQEVSTPSLVFLVHCIGLHAWVVNGVFLWFFQQRKKAVPALDNNDEESAGLLKKSKPGRNS